MANQPIRRCRREMNMAKFRRLVQQAMGVKHTHRYRTASVTLGTAGLNQIALLTANDAPDFDTGGDFATSAQCEQGSRIIGIDLNLVIKSNSAGTLFEVVLWKDPDAFLNTSGIASLLMQNDVTANALLMRKYTLAYGMWRANTGSDTKHFHMQISRAALRRAGVMKDNDVIRLNIETSADITNTLAGYGRIWTQK